MRHATRLKRIEARLAKLPPTQGRQKRRFAELTRLIEDPSDDSVTGTRWLVFLRFGILDLLATGEAEPSQYIPKLLDTEKRLVEIEDMFPPLRVMCEQHLIDANLFDLDRMRTLDDWRDAHIEMPHPRWAGWTETASLGLDCAVVMSGKVRHPWQRGHVVIEHNGRVVGSGETFQVAFGAAIDTRRAWQWIEQGGGDV